MANWIKKAVNPANKGMLHRSLGVPMGHPIPAAKLSKALNSKNEKTRKQAQFAENMKNLRKK